MASVIVFLIIVSVIVFLVSLFTSAGILFWLKRVFKFPNPSYKRSIKILLITGIANFLISILILVVVGVLEIIIRVPIPHLGEQLILACLVVIATFFIFHFLLKRHYQNDWKKSLYLYLTFGAITVILLFLIVILPRQFIISPFSAQGSAMEPSFQSGDYLLIKKFGKQYLRGDVIVLHRVITTDDIFNPRFDSPENLKSFSLKRIVGLPNEKIEIRDDKVFINGQILNEPYVGGVTEGGEFTSLALEDNQYFVLGDNRATSLDSRKFGPVSINDIEGKVWQNVSGWFGK